MRIKNVYYNEEEGYHEQILVSCYLMRQTYQIVDPMNNRLPVYIEVVDFDNSTGYVPHTLSEYGELPTMEFSDYNNIVADLGHGRLDWDNLTPESVVYTDLRP